MAHPVTRDGVTRDSAEWDRLDAASHGVSLADWTAAQGRERADAVIRSASGSASGSGSGLGATVSDLVTRAGAGLERADESARTYATLGTVVVVAVVIGIAFLAIAYLRTLRVATGG